MTAIPTTTRFKKLVDDIGALYLKARGAQVTFAWETGRRIVEEEQNGEMRAQYGSALISKLSETLMKKYGAGFSVSNLRRMRQFYLLNQKRAAPRELDWAAYLELMPVKDPKLRTRLEKKVRREGLNSRQLRRLVRETRRSEAVNDAALIEPKKSLSPLKRPTDLKLNTFSLSPLKVKLKDNQVLIDCGFFVSWPVDKADLKNINIVETMSYTYSATIDRVVDGDTLLVLIEVGFGIIVRDRLRLRGINCPEVSTPEGVQAKKYVEKLLPAGTTIVLQSHKCQTDVYGRFVADIFFQKDVADPSSIIKNGTYLNQELIDQGWAELY